MFEEPISGERRFHLILAPRSQHVAPAIEIDDTCSVGLRSPSKTRVGLGTSGRMAGGAGRNGAAGHAASAGTKNSGAGAR
jgi:hypothetical protein